MSTKIPETPTSFFATTQFCALKKFLFDAGLYMQNKFGGDVTFVKPDWNKEQVKRF